MTGPVEQAVFLDQVEVGDRFRLAWDTSPPWLVTGRRTQQTTGASWLAAVRYLPVTTTTAEGWLA